MSDDMYDFKSMLNIPQRQTAARRQELLDSTWADYGQMLSVRIADDGGLERAINIAVLQGCSPKEIARRVRLYLTTGVVHVTNG